MPGLVCNAVVFDLTLTDFLRIINVNKVSSLLLLFYIIESILSNTI